MTKPGIAVVRWHVSRIRSVTSTWFEWELDDSGMAKTLVVEVDFDTDPNSPAFRRSVMDAIESTTKDVLKNETTMVVSRLRVVPKDRS